LEKVVQKAPIKVANSVAEIDFYARFKRNIQSTGCKHPARSASGGSGWVQYFL